MDSNEKVSELSSIFASKFNIKDSADPSIVEFSQLLQTIPTEIPSNFIEHVIKLIVTIPLLNHFKIKLKEEIQAAIDHSTLLLQSKISDIEEKCLGLEHRIESVRKKITSDSETALRKITEVTSYLSTKPWTKEISSVTEELSSRPTFEDLYSMKANLQPPIDMLLSCKGSSEKAIKDFEAVLARMDEILLTKSSKEDLKYLNMHIDTFVSHDHLDKVLPELEARIRALEIFQEESKNSPSQGEGGGKLAQKNVSKDLPTLFNKLAALSERLDEKMDKVEILPILETNDMKDIAFKRALEATLNDFQQMAILQQDTLKTMIRNLDPAEKRNKQRNDLYKAAEKLVTNVMLRVNENKNALPSKSAGGHARSSVSPEPQDRVINSSLSRNSNRKSKRQVFSTKSNWGSLNL